MLDKCNVVFLVHVFFFTSRFNKKTWGGKGVHFLFLCTVQYLALPCTVQYLALPCTVQYLALPCTVQYLALPLTHFSLETPKRVICKQCIPILQCLIWIFTVCKQFSYLSLEIFKPHSLTYLKLAGISGSVGCASDWWSGGCEFDPAGSGNILSWRLIVNYFLRSFSPFRRFKEGSCQFLTKECAQVLVA